MMDLKELELLLAQSIASVTPRLEIGLDKLGGLAQQLAAHYPGHEQEGWPPLAESTIRDKQSKGFPVPSPLLRTGELAASYKKEVDLFNLAMVIGSPEKKALWQEMGTSRIPPRPVCEKALKNSLPYAADLFGEIAISLLTGKT
jgi:hypothetical protein